MPPKHKHDPDTPMHALNQATVAKNVQCFGALVSRNVDRIDYLVEGMGGMGNQTKWLREHYRPKKHVAYEIDDICVDALKEIPKVQVKKASFFDSLIDLPRDIEKYEDSLLVFDYNSCTAAPHNWRVMEPVFNMGFKWLVAPDLSRGKLHLNFRSYGFKERPTGYDEYLKAFNKLTSTTKMKIVDHEPTPRAITYILWKRA